MTIHVQSTTTGSHYVLLNERGEPIGKIVRTRYALEKEPPKDTVFLRREE